MDTQSAAPSLARSLGTVPRLSAEDEGRLARLARSGDLAARAELIRCNVPLAIKLASGAFRSYRAKHGEDLVSGAVVGLIQGVDHFDPDRGNRVSTAVRQWVLRGIGLTIKQEAHTIRVPVHLFGDRSHRLAPMADAALACRPVGYAGIPADEDPISHAVTTEEEEVDFEDRAVLVRESVARLEPRLAQVVSLRFGLDGRPPLTFKAIGEAVGLSHTMVHTLHKRAMVELRHMIAG